MWYNIYTFKDKVIIRQYRSSDKKEVWKLHILALQHTNAYIKSGSWDDDLTDIEKNYLAREGEFLVAVMNDKIVAMGGFKPVMKDTAEIKRMRVHPDFQRKGLGQAIYNILESKIKEKEYTIIILDTSINQLAAQKFYIKNGYKEISRNKTIWPIEAIFYQKNLL